MFDPTAFENMKVVIEGALYDRDLDGEMVIINRNDLINLAKLTRTYEVTFSDEHTSPVQCTLCLTAQLENLAAELLPSNLNTKLAGANLSIQFQMKHRNTPLLHNKIEEELLSIWGTGRTFLHQVTLNPFEQSDIISKTITLQFNRLILEDQIDDLTHMIDYILNSIEKIKRILL